MKRDSSVIAVDLGGELVEAEVVRSPRVHVTRIQVGRDRPLRVIVPAEAGDDVAREALRVKSGWVARKLQAVEEARAAPAELGLSRDGEVWVAGEAVPTAVADVRFAREHDGKLLVPTRDPAGAIRRWYRRRARSYLRELVAEEAARLGCTPAGVAVRDQRTRWGSCSRHGRLSLNWRLFLAPEEIARYVVVHELIHLSIPNHSKAFWRALGGAWPDWRDASDWLARHGQELRAYEVQTNASLRARPVARSGPAAPLHSTHGNGDCLREAESPAHRRRPPGLSAR